MGAKIELSDLAEQRQRQLDGLRELQKQLIETTSSMLGQVVSAAFPDARQVEFVAKRTTHRWSGTLLTLETISDDVGREIEWREQLSPEDRELIEELQRDLTEHFAIPEDEVRFSLSLR